MSSQSRRPVIAVGAASSNPNEIAVRAACAICGVCRPAMPAISAATPSVDVPTLTSVNGGCSGFPDDPLTSRSTMFIGLPPSAAPMPVIYLFAALTYSAGSSPSSGTYPVKNQSRGSQPERSAEARPHRAAVKPHRPLMAGAPPLLLEAAALTVQTETPEMDELRARRQASGSRSLAPGGAIAGVLAYNVDQFSGTRISD
jgi:hypothetical protein